MLKPVLIGFAWVCIGWGILSAVIPLVPTTPFLLLGFYILSKYNPRMSRRLKVRIGRAGLWWDENKPNFFLKPAGRVR